MVNINEAYSFPFNVLSKSLGSCNFSTVASISVPLATMFVAIRRIVFQSLLPIFFL